MTMINEFKDEYEWLSNFYPCEIYLNGLLFPTVEHAYMSEKTDDINWKLTCCDASKSPGIIKRSSRNVDLVNDWDAKKLVIMTLCLQQKFSKEPFTTKLLNTNQRYIQEGNIWSDKFWGVCLKTNTGKNMLGYIIMNIRNNLR